MHDHKVIHRDINSENILVADDGIAKLGGFGFARVLSLNEKKVKTIVGNPQYHSPEIIQGLSYGLKADIWALGVVLYEMCALMPPFNGKNKV